jgi:hypothetical protein
MSVANNSLELTKANEFSLLQRVCTCEETCETLWDRVLRICDQWFPTASEVVGRSRC